jgi:LCP family protein required for cell wall assembly
VAAVAALGIGFVRAVSFASAWNSVERVSLSDDVVPSDNQQESTPISSPVTAPEGDGAAAEREGTPTVPEAPPPPDAVLLVGSDSRSGLDDLDDYGDFPGRRADVIVLALPASDEVKLVSIPRDLYVQDICSGGKHRIGDSFEGCGDRHGLSMLVSEVEALAGVEIDHAAAVDLAGFEAVVDRLGGYRICTDDPLRDEKSGLDLDAGCTEADGETTLQWLRSRHTRQLRDGRWETVPHVSDLTRNRRQGRFLVDMFERLTDVSQPGAILDAVRRVAPHLTLDDGLSLRRVTAWGWRLRQAELEVVELPVADEETAPGAAVLVPTVDVAEFIEGTATG